MVPQFDGEGGIDEGGVRKEFFRLLVSQLFDAKYCMRACLRPWSFDPVSGMFTYEPEVHQYCFSQDSLENTSEFELIGIVNLCCFITPCPLLACV